MTSSLILVRHGESEWNALDLFSGWVDVGLSERGEREAVRGAELIRERGLRPWVVHTSVLKRAIRTAEILLEALDRQWIPVRRSWRLNERHYGALQGKNKGQIRQQFGDEQFMLWRRSYAVPPPPLDPEAEQSQFLDERYAGLPPDLRPRTECLADVVVRMLPWWYDAIVPDLARGPVLVAAHGNSLRALVKHLDGVSDQEIPELNIPTGVPLLYELNASLQPVQKGGEYLDPKAAAIAIEAVKNQGRTPA